MSLHVVLFVVVFIVVVVVVVVVATSFSGQKEVNDLKKY